MITLKVKNVPSGSVSWVAHVYYPDGSIFTLDYANSLSGGEFVELKGFTRLDFRFMFFETGPGTWYGDWRETFHIDFYSISVRDGGIYTLNCASWQIEDADNPPQPEYRNLNIYSYTNPVKSGQICEVTVEFEYQGPAQSKLLHAAVGNSGWAGFDEILTGQVYVQIPNSPSWTRYWATVNISVTTAIDPNKSPYDLYAKFNGTFPTIISPTLSNVLTVQNTVTIPDPAWRNIKVASYTPQVEVGGVCNIRVTCEYRGPVRAETLHVAIGASGWAGFDEILAKDQLFYMPESLTWQLVTMDIAVPITQAIDPTKSPYSIYAKIGGTISPTLQNVIVVNGGNPVIEAEFRNLLVTSWTTPVKAGQNCRITVSWEYRGPAMSKALYAAIGAAGWTGFDEILSNSKMISIPKSDDWATLTAYVDIAVTTALDPGGSPYSCYAKFNGAFPEIISPTQQEVIQVEGSNPQFRNLVVKTVTSPVSTGSTCWIETSFEYQGPAASKQLYAAIGIKGIFGFDEVLNAVQDISLPACPNWTARTGKIPIFINESIDPAKSPYDVYAKIVNPELISSVKMGAVVIVGTPGTQEITGQIVDVQPTTIKTGSPLELNVQLQAFNDNAWQQINGWWTRTTITLGTLSGNVETIHLGRDATDTIKVLLGVMGKTALTGKALLEGCPGDAIENPLSPTPPTTGWYKVAEKSITIAPSETEPPTSSSSSWGLAAVAGIAILAMASEGGKSKS